MKRDSSLWTGMYKAERPALSSLWRLAAEILGFLCLILLGAVAILGLKCYKCSPCPENWFWYGEVCYHFSTEWKTWQGSKDYCISHSSKLLQIESKEELGFITPLSSSLWIGLTSKATNRSWIWDDGTTLSTDLFQVNERDYVGDCVVLKDGEVHPYDSPLPKYLQSWHICRVLALGTSESEAVFQLPTTACLSSAAAVTAEP
ncbi:hypothetical protein Y1Q_0017362 [Alligator mississippiensis]|uniref:Natural killer cells antigen CD94 n=1 Tax=Alligator mississippiensis TaxID=8496 RepID=A0A151NGH1_ALLMI|nr:hypothetical protein Y1Q_0017362 [Alligator mississippiensis]